jgi:hypothetical protein
MDTVSMPIEEERLFAAKLLRRALLAARDRIIDAHYREACMRSASLETEEAIEAEAVRLCRPEKASLNPPPARHPRFA